MCCQGPSSRAAASTECPSNSDGLASPAEAPSDSVGAPLPGLSCEPDTPAAAVISSTATQPAEPLLTPFTRQDQLPGNPSEMSESDGPIELRTNGHHTGHGSMRKAASVDVFAALPGASLPSTRSEDGERR